MSDIAIVGSGAGRLDTSAEVFSRVQSRSPGAGRTERPSDRVELSDRARLLNKLANLPPVRQDLIDQVKREIENGTYDTPGRLDGAIDHLADDLDLIG
jgi:negative regulator of flagellin synthesis FlgM